MTTIAFSAKDGVMACDSCWTDCNDVVIGTLQTKIFKLTSGAVVGEAGDNDSRAVRELLDKVDRLENMPAAKDLAETHVDYAGIVCLPDGKVAQILIEHDKEKGWCAQVFPVNRGYTAVGSGGPLAIGYMGALEGKGAVAAVKFACDNSVGSKLPVHSVQVWAKPTQRIRSVTTGPR